MAAAATVNWITDGEAGNALVTNRAVKFLLSVCGIDTTLGFTGFAPVHNAKAYGATGLNVVDDATALNDAYAGALAGTNGASHLHIPAGNYKTASNLVWQITGTAPRSVRITGDANASIIFPTAAVTIGLTLAAAANTDGTTSTMNVEDLRIDMVNTAGATGCLVGENAGNLAGRHRFRNVTIMRAAGVGGKGLYVKNVVDATFFNCYFGRSYENVYINGSDVSLPTAITFIKCSFREATTHGVNHARGYSTTFRDCVFESNGAEAVYCVTSAANENNTRLLFDGGWMENQYAGSGSQATSYAVYMDGSLGGTISVTIRSMRFSGASRAIYWKSVVDASIDNCGFVNAANQVVLDTGCIGTFGNWPQNNAPFATVVTNGSPTTFNSIQVSWAGRVWVEQSSGDLLAASSNAFSFGNATFYWKRLFLGDALFLKGAANGATGTAVLVAGTVTVAHTGITANSIIIPTVTTGGGTRGDLSFSCNPGVGFTISSSSGADTSTVRWVRMEAF